MRAVMVGAAGRMGAALARLSTQTQAPAVRWVGAIERSDSPAIGQDFGELSGIAALGVTVSTDLSAALRDAEVMIDFSSAQRTADHLRAASQQGVAALVGTTGLDSSIDALARDAAREIPLLIAANTSLGVTLLRELVRMAAQALPSDFDIEIGDLHHRHKVDAPSGTALALARSAALGRGIDPAAIDSAPRGSGARRPGQIGFAIQRAGDAVGSHAVLFAGTGERLTLSHEATDRTIFARGALEAAAWLVGRVPGRYEMSDVIGLKTKV